MRRSHDDGQGGTPGARALRRRSGRRSPVRTDAERINALAASADLPVEEVLREVADFRLALETDMIIAAAAMDAEAPDATDLLGDVVDAERAELATFHDRVLGRLADAAAADELALRRAAKPRRTSRLVASAAAAVAVLSLGRIAVTAAQSPRTVRASNASALAAAQQQYSNFSSAVSSDSPTAVQSTAQQLHTTLQTLINEHAADPEVARQTAQLLQAEISLLRANDPQGANAVLAKAQELVRMLQGAAPPQVRENVKPLLDPVAPKPPAKAPAKAKAKPSPSPSPSPAKPSPSPRPSSSPAPSQSPGAGQPPIAAP